MQGSKDIHEDLTEKTIHSTPLTDGVLIKAYRDLAELPDGRQAIREWIKHPGAAAIVPVTAEGEIVMIDQFRYAPRRTFLEVPAGKFDTPTETPLAVAQRELEEETGYQAKTWISLGGAYPCIGYADEIIHLFLALDLSQHGQHLAADEYLRVRHIPIGEVYAKLFGGTIDDMKTNTALARALPHLKERGLMA